MNCKFFLIPLGKLNFLVIIEALLILGFSSAHGLPKISRAPIVKQSTVLVLKAQSKEEAKSMGQQKAALDEALRLSQKMMGKDQFSKLSKTMSKELLADIGRFTPQLDVVKVAPGSSGYNVTIRFKISEADLKQVLIQRGWLNAPLNTGVVLPFITVTDHTKQQSHYWWNPGPQPSMLLQQTLLDFENGFSKEFLGAGFQVLKPENMKMAGLVPSPLRKNHLTQEDMSKVSRLKRSELFIEGNIDLLDSPIEKGAYRLRIKMMARKSTGGESLAEVIRSVELSSGKSIIELQQVIGDLALDSGKELSSQLASRMKMGEMSRNSLLLTLSGKLNHQELHYIKKTLSTELPAVEKIQERFFKPGEITLKVFYSGGADSMKSRLEKMSLQGFQKEVVNSSTDEVTLGIKSARQ